MEAASTAVVAPSGGAPIQRGGYRGRGAGAPLRGGFKRGMGRGLGRGHFMGSVGSRGMIPGGMGGGGIPPGRGMREVRGGGPGGYQGRGGFVPRGGPSLRGRPVYTQQTKQHSGAENNKTVSPVPPAAGATTTPGEDAAAPVAVSTTSTSNATNGSPSAASTAGNGNGVPSSRGMPRGRGGSFVRGGGRGGVYVPHSNGSVHHSVHSGMSGPGMEHGHMPIRRGGPPRGRGGYAPSMTRSPMHQQHTANTQIAPVPSLKRGAGGGPPGPKRGRYEGGPYSQRPMAPKYHHPPQHVTTMAPQPSYGAPPNHHQQPPSHHGYPPHDQSQVVDPYAQSYAVPATQNTYNGYGQNSGYVSHAPPAPQASSGYTSHHSSEYDHSQYQSYNSTYGTQQDTRYQSYGQDYTQQYGAPAVDYNTTSQTDYSHHGQQSYDERAYAAYDSQSYQQNYSNATGYY